MGKARSKALSLAFLAVVFGCGGRAVELTDGGAGAPSGGGETAGGAGQVGGTHAGGASTTCNLDTSACNITPADVACSLDSDCFFLVVPRCSCTTAIVGVNLTNSVKCVLPDCNTPTYDTAGCPSISYQLQDCRVTGPGSKVQGVCVAGRCLSAPCDACL